MSKYIYVALVAAIVFMSGTAQAVLTHQYTFNEVYVKDSVGNMDGDLMGAASLVGGYLVLNGGGDYVNLLLPNGGDVFGINQYDELTIEFWSAQPDIANYWSMTVVFGAQRNGWEGIDYVGVATARQDNFTRSMLRGRLAGAVAGEIGQNGPEYNDEMLHHYVLTVGPQPECCAFADMLTLYIDGQLQGMGQLLGRSLADVSNARADIGRSTWADPTWVGFMDELRIYDNSLSCEEIQASYAAGPTPYPEPATLVLLGLGSMALLRRRK